MILNPDSLKPIYIQIAEWLELEILQDAIKSDEKIYSQYQLAEMFNVNPATAAKGLSLLAEENFLYKKRGLGMFVAPQAKERIRQKRINENLQQLVFEVVAEAKRLQVPPEELVNMIQRATQQAVKEE
ncbi:MAG TPA: GntR family transcriptional regulator [Firmicutes bacterium]|nr:GntR family transcriptional regulator [Bacillota bacterium]HAA37833.1 GntR family transcriptional regulator [Bacillota bacterium]